MGHDAISALAVCTKEIDEAKGTDYHERFLNYLKEYQRNDWDGCCAQTDSKGDRLKRPSEQPNPDAYVHVVEKSTDGIVVSGVKMSITQVAYADEMFVLPTRALMEDDSAFAVAFAVPADWEGVHLITRPVWHREKDDPDASPFCKYGVSDSVVVFDNVFVPNEARLHVRGVGVRKTDRAAVRRLAPPQLQRLQARRIGHSLRDDGAGRRGEQHPEGGPRAGEALRICRGRRARLSRQVWPRPSTARRHRAACSSRTRSMRMSAGG